MQNNNIATMKLFPRTHSTSQNCFCTFCLNKSESEQSSIKKYNLHGSRLDRLYGKYIIPLCQRKLLNRSVRARAINDLITRLISDSTLSLVKKPGLRPRSECCSCCSCSWKVRISESDGKEYKYKRPYIRGPEAEYGKNIQPRLKERCSKRRLHFKAKHISSDPCSRTFKVNGIDKKKSKASIQKIHLIPLEQLHTKEEQAVIKESKLQYFGRKSYQKYQSIQEKLQEVKLLLQKLNQSREKARKKIVIHEKKSLQGLNPDEYDLKANIESGLNSFESLEYPEEETKFEIKKDSIVKFKDYLKRKGMMKDWEGDFDCLSDTYVPERGFNIIKLRHFHKRNRQRDRKLRNKHKVRNQNLKVDRIPLSKSSTSVQQQQFAETTLTHMEQPKVRGRHITFETTKLIKFSGKQGELKKKFQQEKIENTVNPTGPVFVPKEKDFGNVKETTCIRRKHGISKDSQSQPLKIYKSDTSRIRIGSSSSSEMKFRKTRPVLNIFNRSNETCYKGNVFRRKSIKVHRHHKISQVIFKSSFETSERTQKKPKEKSNKHETKMMMHIHSLLKNICPLKTNIQYETKSVSSLTKKPATADKSVSKELKTKQHLSQISYQKLTSDVNPSYHKSAVRFGSSFGFDLEFYKTNNQNERKIPSITGEVKVTQHKISKVIKRNTKLKNKNYVLLKVKRPSIKSMYIRALNTLNKCFSLLKLNKFGKIKKKNTSTISSFASETKLFLTSSVDKNIETNRRRPLKLPPHYRIPPYEYEPGMCVPSECEPLICHKILEKRNSKFKRVKSVGTYTSSRKTKSASSIVSRLITRRKAKVVQSSVITTKVAKTTQLRKYKRKYKLGQNVLNINDCGRQVVRNGSNFSFNIEICKDKQTLCNASKSRVSTTLKAVQYKARNSQRNQQQQQNKKLKPMNTQVIGWDYNIKTYLRRCFSTFKLYKNKNIQHAKLRKRKIFTADTQIVGKVLPKIMSKHTETKWKANYKLLSFKCDSNICLENIQRRILNTKEYGMFTPKPKTRSILSSTENSCKTSTAVLAHPKLYCKGTNMKYMKILDTKPRCVAQTDGYGKSFTYGNCKQIVRIGSSCNFSFKLCKQLPQAVTLSEHSRSIQTRKYRDNTRIKVTQVFRDINTQSQVIKKVHRQKKTKQLYHRGSCLSTNKYFIPRVYTVNTAITNDTEFISHPNIEEDLKPNASRKMISISANSFLLKKCDVAKYGTFQVDHALKMGLVCLKQPTKIHSNLSVDVEFQKKYCPLRTFNLKHPIKSFSFACRDGKLRERVNVFSQISERNLEKLTYVHQYLGRRYCIVNMQNSRGNEHKKCLIDSKTVPTKTDTKYLPVKEFIPLQCNHNIDPDHSKNNSLIKGIKEDVVTILHYTPKKFNKKESKMENKFENLFDRNDKPLENLIFYKCKRLTTNKGKISIPTKNLKNGLDPSFSCRGVRLLAEQNKRIPIASGKQDTKNNDHHFNVMRVLRKSKNPQLTKTVRDENCPIVSSKYTVKSRIKIGQGRHSNSEERGKSDFKHQKTLRVSFADSTKCPNFGSNPCVYGSKECAKQANKNANKSQLKVKHGKRCVYPNPVCKNETKKIKEQRELVGQCQEIVAKSIPMGKTRKILEKQLKINHTKHELQRGKRVKLNKELDRQVKDCKNGSTLTLMAGSMIDIGKVRVKRESDGAATASRIRTRISFMKRIRAMKNKLEQYPVTHFLLRAADWKAKTRLFKLKSVKRVRGPLDFQCSLNMASLRRRSNLCVYYKCPSFYSHFMTMLNTCKQFVGIMMFLLAAVARTPFILCIAVGSKAIMCCCCCTR